MLSYNYYILLTKLSLLFFQPISAGLGENLTYKRYLATLMGKAVKSKLITPTLWGLHRMCCDAGSIIRLVHLPVKYIMIWSAGAKLFILFQT